MKIADGTYATNKSRCLWGTDFYIKVTLNCANVKFTATKFPSLIKANHFQQKINLKKKQKSNFLKVLYFEKKSFVSQHQAGFYKMI